MRRRAFIGFLASAAAWSIVARAEGPVPLIGILDPDVPFIFDAFVAGMRELGYVEGQNIAYARRAARGKFDALPALAAELAELKVVAIVTLSEAAVRAVRRASPTIPVVFLTAADPVSTGLIESLAHPGGHTTGLTFLEDDLAAKRLDLLRQLIPGLRDVAVFYVAASGKGKAFEKLEQTARTLGLEIHGASIADAESIEAAFQGVANARIQAIDFIASPFLYFNRERLARLAQKYRLPAIYFSVEFVRAGGLIAYGPVWTDMGRRGATLVEKILKGRDPGDIPVEITNKFALTINLKSASALGLTIPADLLAAADEVIE